MKFNVNDRVSLKKGALSLSYIASRAFYTNMYENKKGRVLGYSQSGKVAVEFDDIVFTDTNRLSSHNNGCHNAGKLHYCWYIPEEYLASENQITDDVLLLL